MAELPLLHIAGVVLEANGRLRQRCGWCGAVLVDYELERVARKLEPDEDPENPRPWLPGTFEPGVYVRIEGSNPTYYSTVEPEPHPEKPERVVLPEGSCVDLPDEATL